MIEMSIPKSKMLSASRAIMAIANKTRESREISHKSIQNQTVNINLQRSENSGFSVPRAAESPSYPTIPDVQENPTYQPFPSVAPGTIGPVVQERSVSIGNSPNFAEPETPVQSPTNNYANELNSLYNLVNNYETVAQALILIIDLIQSNPLIINKYIVPNENTFRELICILTNAEDVDIKRVEDVGCTLSSKKYDLIDDIFVISDGDPKSLKYGYPEVARLFDRFNISLKMVCIQK